MQHNPVSSFSFSESQIQHLGTVPGARDLPAGSILPFPSGEWLGELGGGGCVLGEHRVSPPLAFSTIERMILRGICMACVGS